MKHMKNSKQIRQLAKAIIHSSKHDNVVDESMVSKFVTQISKDSDKSALRLLNELEHQLTVEEQKNTIFVESAYNLDKEQLEKIRSSFEKNEDRKLTIKFSINKNLLAGLRIRLGDFVWEKSVVSNLQNLKGTLSYE